RGTEPPSRLSQREYLDFTGPFPPSIAKLREHIAWLRSPDGELLQLRVRLKEAKRDLGRAPADQRARIEEEIQVLGGRIAEGERIVSDPQAAMQHAAEGIAARIES